MLKMKIASFKNCVIFAIFAITASVAKPMAIYDDENRIAAIDDDMPSMTSAVLRVHEEIEPVKDEPAKDEWPEFSLKYFVDMLNPFHRVGTPWLQKAQESFERNNDDDDWFQTSVKWCYRKIKKLCQDLYVYFH